jgi:DNA-binding SARP family transcriptional activator
LTTFGGMTLVRCDYEGSATTLLGPGKPLALITYLVCCPQRGAGRDHLTDLLWADAAPDAARHTLRQTIWYLRQRLGDGALQVAREDGRLTLCTSVTCDRDDFLAACDGGDLERAVTSYAGDFLPSFGAPGAAGFEHWADLERDRLRLLFFRAVEQLVHQQLASAHFHEARQLACRARDLDLEREQGWRLYLETLLAGSDGQAAELEAIALERTLAEREREMEPATRALLDLVRRAQAERGGSAARGLVAELVGREREFAGIVAAWEQANKGPGTHIHISAGAGVGKTRLLADAFRRLRATGARVVLVRAYLGGRHVTYALAADLAGALAQLPGAAGVSPAAAASLVALNPSLSARFAADADRSTAAEALRRRSYALRELVASIGDNAPLAVLVDDVHWADGESRQLLQAVIDHVAAERVLVVTTARPVADGAVVGPASQTWVLSPLTASEIGALVSSLGELPDEAWTSWFPDALREASGGAPLLVLETLQLAIDRGTLMREHGRWTCPEPAALQAELRSGAALHRRIESLEPAEAKVLLALAVGGALMPADLVGAAAEAPLDRARADLARLEQRGFVSRTGDAYEPAHDEIARRVLESAPPNTLQRVNAALGTALASGEGTDAGHLQHAARHLAAAEAQQALCAVFVRWATAARRRGDRRGTRELCRELLGDAWSERLASSLVQSLPWHHRLGLYSPARVATATGIGLALAGGFVATGLRPPAPPVDATLIVVASDERAVNTVFAVPLQREGWNASKLIEPGVRLRYAPPASLSRWGLQPSPDGGLWVYNRISSDSGGIDLYLRDRDGNDRRLTAAPGDDVNPRWSPDGKELAFATTRWNSNRWSDVAVLDIATGRVTRLTAGEESDDNPIWSPDGTTIAYAQTDYRQGRVATRLCHIGVDGAGNHCTGAIAGLGPGSIVAWHDVSQLIVQSDRGRVVELARADLDEGSLMRVASLLDAEVLASPDGRWIACLCRQPEDPHRAWYVFPADRPDLARKVGLGSEEPPRTRLYWVNGDRPPSYLNRLGVEAASDTILLGVPHRLRAIGQDQGGAPMAPRRLRWRSLDTSIATVAESTGVVVPRGLGTFTVGVSAGGWRTAERRLVIRAPMHRFVFSESWSQGLSAEWVPYGEPRPAVTVGLGGVSAFWTQGDGWFESGVYLRRNLTARWGLGVEALWSTPVIGPRQQYNVLGLQPWDEAALQAWDHRTGNPPGGVSGCTVRYPPRDGIPDEPYVVLAQRQISIHRGANSGAWYRVRVQILPDGRCAVAVHGRLIWVSQESLPLDRPYRLVLSGNSVGAKMLVGQVRLWEGVLDGIDWGTLERR